MANSLDCPKCKTPLEEHEVSQGIVVYTCPACFGVLYDKEVLAVPLKLGATAPSAWKCPRCQGVLGTGSSYDSALMVDYCAACGAVWFDAGEIQILRKLTGVENLAGRRVEEEVEAEPGRPASVSAPAPVRPVSAKQGEPAKVMPPEMSNAKNPDAERAPSVTLEGRVYQHFQTSAPVTTSVLGEFPWVAKVGDVTRMRDFICPPYLLSQEVTEV